MFDAVGACNRISTANCRFSLHSYAEQTHAYAIIAVIIISFFIISKVF